MPRAHTKPATTPGGWPRNPFGPWLLLPLAVCSAAGLASWFARADPAASSRAASPVTERERSASRLYQQHCARCPGEDGTGSSLRDSTPEAPDFRSRAWQRARSDTELLVTILEGKGTRMPAFAGRISEQETRELQMELEDLKKRFRELAVEPRKS